MPGLRRRLLGDDAGSLAPVTTATGVLGRTESRAQRDYTSQQPPGAGSPRRLSGSRIGLQGRRLRRRGFDPWVGKIPWRAWLPASVFFPGGSHGQRSLRAAVHGSAKSQTSLKGLSAHPRGRVSRQSSQPLLTSQPRPGAEGWKAPRCELAGIRGPAPATPSPTPAPHAGSRRGRTGALPVRGLRPGLAPLSAVQFRAGLSVFLAPAPASRWWRPRPGRRHHREDGRGREFGRTQTALAPCCASFSPLPPGAGTDARVLRGPWWGCSLPKIRGGGAAPGLPSVDFQENLISLRGCVQVLRTLSLAHLLPTEAGMRFCRPRHGRHWPPRLPAGSKVLEP